MLKIYELTDRHFGWDERPSPASERQSLDYLLDRALRAQGLVSLDSICHLDANPKPAIRFALPVLVDEEIVAAIDLKTDREKRKLRIQKWSWVGPGSPRAHKRCIEEALHCFECFQLTHQAPDNV
jgi:uncharacterized protein YcaQ